MGSELAVRYAAARRVFAMADEVMGMPLTRMMWEGPESALKETRFTQPAILAHSLAVLAVLRDLYGELKPALAAGHSLGEYGALVAAQVLTPTDALALVKRRGELMQTAGETQPGAMAAVVGLDTRQVEGILAQARDAGVIVAANMNAPDQIVVSGMREAVAAASELAAAAGAKRVVPLAVSAAFHSPLMSGVSAALAETVRSVAFSRPVCPVVPNVTAVPTDSVDEIRRCLLCQIESPVRWHASMTAMLAHGICHFLEIGPGRVLAGLVKRINRDARVLAVADPDGVAAVREALGGSAPAGSRPEGGKGSCPDV
jgi:[acyl-carrier-protein] S-malonyltransferase